MGGPVVHNVRYIYDRVTNCYPITKGEYIMAKNVGTIEIIGVPYEVMLETEEENPKLESNDGLCEIYAKQIILDISCRNNKNNYDNMNEYYQRLIRHEVFHAIFAEIGNIEWCKDETLVDTLAMLYPRIEEIMKQARKIGDDINAL